MLPIDVFYLDDDLFEQRRVRDQLAPSNVAEFKICCFTTANEFTSALQKHKGKVLVLLDIHLGKDETQNGIDLISKIRKAKNDATIIMFSSDFNLIEKCIQLGADDFVLKTDDLSELPLRLYTIYRYQERAYDVSHASLKRTAPKVIGKTMLSIEERIKRIIGTAVRSIYVNGPTGVGKEVVADILQNYLPDGTPFIRVNCAAIAPNLLEAELFGHAKGAYTGAQHSRIGWLEAASGGWIFLDEVASLSLSAQAALLRAIENQQIIRLGESTPRKIQVRFLSAANRSLASMVKEETFRNDLLQRLREAEILIPSLAERLSEVDAFIDHFCDSEVGGPYRMSPEARKILHKVDWQKGNVRAVRNCIRAMTEFNHEGLLVAKGIPQWVWELRESENKSADNQEPVGMGKFIKVSLPEGAMPSFETLCDLLLANAIEEMLKQPGAATIRKISTALGMARSTLTYRIKRLIDVGLLRSSAVEQLFNGKKDAS